MNWWQGMCKNICLKDLAVAIIQLPASSAATERSFRTYNCIHINKKRNRLTVDRAGKLTFVSYNSKLLREEGIYAVLELIHLNSENITQIESDLDEDLEETNPDEDADISSASSTANEPNTDLE